MIHSSNDRYTGDAYLKANPDWNLQDAPWKASIISEIMQKNHLLPASVTDVGCGAGGILKELRKSTENNVRLVGYDISPAAIALAKSSDSDAIEFLCGDYLETDQSPAELILLMDVLEHVDDYYGFLRRLRKKSTQVIFHVPLDLSVRSMLRPHIIKQQRDSVGHIHYFSRELFFWSLKDTGFEIVDWKYTRPTSDRSRSASLWRTVKKRFRNFSFTLLPSLSAKLWGEYSIIVLAQ
jgi:SAM-dependent methyltransferase